MKSDNNIFAHIFDETEHLTEAQMQAYLEGGLTPDEVNAIEAHLIDCDLCAGAIEGLIGIDGIELDDIENRINARVDELAAAPVEEETAKVIEFSGRTQAEPAAAIPARRSPFRWMGIAASIMLLAVVGFWMFSPKAGFDPDLQGGANYLSSTRRGGDGNGLSKALALYRSEKYDDAAQMLQNEQTEDGRYLLGLSYLGADQPNKAVEVLEGLDSTQKQEPVEWYLAYAYLKNGQKDKAVALLESIKDKPEGDYSQRATDFLKQIQEMN